MSFLSVGLDDFGPWLLTSVLGVVFSGTSEDKLGSRVSFLSVGLDDFGPWLLTSVLGACLGMSFPLVGLVFSVSSVDSDFGLVGHGKGIFDNEKLFMTADSFVGKSALGVSFLLAGLGCVVSYIINSNKLYIL